MAKVLPSREMLALKATDHAILMMIKWEMVMEMVMEVDTKLVSSNLLVKDSLSQIHQKIKSIL